MVIDTVTEVCCGFCKGSSGGYIITGHQAEAGGGEGTEEEEEEVYARKRREKSRESS